MHNDFDALLARLDRQRIPVLLLGGINLVRTLGEAGIPAIVASADGEDPARDSRFCKGVYEMPPLDAYLYWHANVDNEPANRWLREQLAQSFETGQ